MIVCSTEAFTVYIYMGKLQESLPGKRPQAKRPMAKKPPAKRPPVKRLSANRPRAKTCPYY